MSVRCHLRTLVPPLAVVVAGLALVPAVLADIGFAVFGPTSAQPGDTVRVALDPCPYPAADIRISLIAEGEGVEGGDSDAAVPVEASDAGAPGEFRIVVPELPPGRYGVLAECPRGGSAGFYGSEEYLRVTGTPDTATLVAPTRTAPGPEPWRFVILVVAGALGMGCGVTRATAGRPACR